MSRLRTFIAASAVALLTATSAFADTVLITGANRGLGLEFARQYAAKGFTVIATARKPEEAKELNELAAKNKSITVEKLDVLDEKAIDALAAKYKGKPVDILINNAGVHGDSEGQTLGSFNEETFETVMNTNVFGVLRVTQAFVDSVAISNQKKIISVSSPAGSFTPRPPVKPEAGRESLPEKRAAATKLHSQLFYGASKAALNHTMTRLRGQLRNKGIAVGLIAPYTVETDMLAEIGYNRPARSLEDGVAGLIKAIDMIDLKHNGKPIGDDGYVMEW